MAATPKLLPESIFNPKLYTSILSLWFANLPVTATAPDEDTSKRWFGMGSPNERAHFDTACTKLCRDALNALSPEQWPLPNFESFEVDRKATALVSAPFRAAIAKDASRGPESLVKVDIALSLTLLLDQIPRNVFRDAAGQRLVYSHYDRISRCLVSSILHGSSSTGEVAGLDIKDLDLDAKYRLCPTRRLWFYLPLMHSEDLVHHDEYSSRVEALRDAVAKSGDKDGAQYVDTTIAFEAKHRVLLERFGRYPHRNGPLGRTATEAEAKFLADGGDTFGSG